MTQPRIINSKGHPVALAIIFTPAPGGYQADVHSDRSCTPLQFVDMLTELVESFKASPTYLEAVFEHVHPRDPS